MKVFLSACGEGFGHSSRMAAALRALQMRGHGGVIATYGPALDRLKKMGLPVFETLPELSMVGREGKFDVMRSVLATSANSGKFFHAVRREAGKIKSMRAKAVISDSRISTAIAGNMLGLPVLYVCNQTWYYKKPANPFDLANIKKRAISRLMSAPLMIPPFFSDMILIPDFPPPDTVCLPLLSRKKNMKKMTFFTGPVTLATLEKKKSAKWMPDKTKVLVTAGGQAFRKGAFERLNAALGGMPQFDFLVTSVFVEKDEQKGNVIYRRYIPDIRQFQTAADILVMPAGHSAIMESIVLGKPSVLLPDDGQPEQLSNAKRYKKLGFGDYLELKNIERLGMKLAGIEEKMPQYLNNLSRLSKTAGKEMNGAVNLAKICEDYVKRTDY